MNHAEQQHLSADADNCIAPNTSTALDNPSKCAKAKKHSFSRAGTPRINTVTAFDTSKPGVWRERRDLYRSLCLTPKGRISIAAAELYTDILDLFIGNSDRIQNFNHRDGCYYWGRSIAKWAKRYGCTEAQFDAWLEILRDRGLIATCMMKTPTNMLQVRPLVAAGSACLSGWPDSQNFTHLLNAETQAQQGSQTGFPPNAAAAISSQCSSSYFLPPKSLGLAVSFGSKESDSVPDGTTAAPEISKGFQAEAEKPTPKTNPEIKDGKGLKPVPDVVEKIPGFSTVVGAWIDEVREHWPQHDCPLTNRQPKVVMDIRSKVHGAGIGWREFLTVVLTPKHWRRACGGAAACPRPEFLSQHLPEFLAYYRAHNPEALAAAEQAGQQAMDALLAKLAAEEAAKPKPTKKPGQFQQLIAPKMAA